MRACNRALLLAALCVLVGANAGGDYSKFHVVSSTEAFEQALADRAVTSIFLTRGTYELQKGVEVSGGRALRVHGGDAMNTIVSLGAEQARPIFQVSGANSHLSLATLKLAVSGDVVDTAHNATRAAVLGVGDEAVDIEILDCNVFRGALVMRAAGTMTVQGTSLGPMGFVRASLFVDHPSARLTFVGGGGSNHASPSQFGADNDVYHMRARCGNLTVLTTSFEGNLGDADARVDGCPAAEAKGRSFFHRFAAVRSEGHNGYNRNMSYQTRFLRVVGEASDAPFGVLAENVWMAGRIPLPPRTPLRNSELARVGGDGEFTLWVLGGMGFASISTLVSGEAPRSTVVAASNLIWGHDGELIPVKAARVLHAENLYIDSSVDKITFHRAALADPEGSLSSARDVPLPPRAPKTPVLTLPAVRAVGQLPLLDAKADGGAVGDGVADDTSAIQRLLNRLECESDKVSQNVFFPEGRYRLTAPLLLHHRNQTLPANCTWGAVLGGWLVGEGSGRSVLFRAPSANAASQSVFATEGMGYATISGLSFEAAGFRDPAFDLEWAGKPFIATQMVFFHDVTFTGGRHGLGIGLAPAIGQVSENMMVNCRFGGGSLYGVGVGQWNALNNVVLNGTFEDVVIAIGNDDDARYTPGGSGHILEARMRNVSTVAAARVGCGSGWLIQGVEAPGANTVAYPGMLYRNCAFGAGGGGVTMDYKGQAGAIIADSEIACDSRIEVSSGTPAGLGANYLLALRSRLPDAHVAPGSANTSRVDLVQRVPCPAPALSL